MDRKLGKRGVIEVKAEGDSGIVRAAFASFNTIDLDGDVTIPGAFGAQDVRIAQWGHNWGDLPVGRGKISESGSDAILDGSFFLSTDHGRNTFETVKGLGDLQEWSYGFDIVKSSFGEFEGQPVRFIQAVKVHEVSPVMLGAGIGTRTLDVKGLEKAGLAFLTHSEIASASLADVRGFIERAASLADVRAKEGRTFSAANLERLGTLAETMRTALASLDELLTSGKAPDAGDEEEAKSIAASLFAQFVNITR